MSQGLPGQVVDIPILPLDQNSPVTEGPVGRLKSLINAEVAKFQPDGNGSVRYTVKKRSGFQTLVTKIRDASGADRGDFGTGINQLVYGGDGKTLTVVGNDTIYQLANDWLRNDGNTNALTYFPQTLRQDYLYAADSQVTAPDFASVGNVTCSVWREYSRFRVENAIPDLSFFPSLSTTALDGTGVSFRNEVTKTFIRPPFRLVNGSETYNNVKVASDGTYFYVFQSRSALGTPNTPIIRVTVFDQKGFLITTGTISIVNNSDCWDVSFLTGAGVIFSRPNGGHVLMAKVVYNGSSLTITTNTDSSIACASAIMAWLENPIEPTHAYLVTADNDGVHTHTHTLKAYRITTGLVQDHVYPDVAGPIGSETASLMKWIGGIAGYATASSNSPLVVAFTVHDFTGVPEFTQYDTGGNGQDANPSASNRFPDQNNNYVQTVSVPFTGSSTNIMLRYSQSLVSRAFRIDNVWVCVTYYPARKWGPLPNTAAATPHFPFRIGDANNLQGTWFVIPLTGTQQIAGRFEYALASADWQTIIPLDLDNTHTTYTAFETNHNLVAARTMVNGAIALPLPYRIEQNASPDKVASQPFFGGTVNNIQNTVNNATVGLKQFYIGPDIGRPFQANGVTFMPGLLGSTLEGTSFAEHGCMAFEAPWILKDGVAGNQSTANNAGQHVYQLVAEVTSNYGKLYRSNPSPQFSFVNPGTTAANLVNYHNVNPTLHDKLKVSIYRSSVVEAVPVPVFTKITSDLQPAYNDPTIPINQLLLGTPTAFSDRLSPDLENAGEPLYTTNGELPHFSAPASRGGCVWLNRTWLIGYDQALWFSNEMIETEQPWFNVAFRIPINDEITAIVPMDDTLIVLCKNSLKRIDAAQLPDATGSPDVTLKALDLPFNNGCTGFAALVRPGVVYSSSTGGVWMITRQLTNVWIGDSARDYLQGNGIVIQGMEVDGSNRLIVLAGNNIVVYDTTCGCWEFWDVPGTPNQIGVYQGNPVFCDGNGITWQYNAALDHDVDTTSGEVDHFIQLLVELSAMHFGNIRGWKRTRAIQIQGTVKSDIYFKALLYYNDAGSGAVTFYARKVSAAEDPTMEVEIRPQIDTSESLDLIIFDETTLTGSPTLDIGAGFTIDIVSAEVALEKGLRKVDKSKRAPAGNVGS